MEGRQGEEEEKGMTAGVVSSPPSARGNRIRTVVFCSEARGHRGSSCWVRSMRPMAEVSEGGRREWKE